MPNQNPALKTLIFCLKSGIFNSAFGSYQNHDTSFVYMMLNYGICIFFITRRLTQIMIDYLKKNDYGIVHINYGKKT